MKDFFIKDRKIGKDEPCYIIAEVSCNHEGDFQEARRIIEAAADAGADAVKLQTYKPETISRDFKTRAQGTIWENIDLFKLYDKASTPWEWYADLQKVADDNGVHLFSSPFDETAVDFLEEMQTPVFKVPSFEVVDTKLLQKIAATGKPVLISNGMTDYLEISEAIEVLRAGGTEDLAILHCNSGYPADFEEANLATIPAMAALFDTIIGISDHTLFSDTKNYAAPMGHITPFEAVKLGAKIIEVHLMLDRTRARALMEKQEGGFDWPFSREPAELRRMVDMVRAWEAGEDVGYETEAERAVAARTKGSVCFEPTEKEMASRGLRPSLWVVEDIQAGGRLQFCGGKPGNIDSIRPAGGLHVRFADFVDGKRAAKDIKAGTPLAWDMVVLD